MVYGETASEFDFETKEEGLEKLNLAVARSIELRGQTNRVHVDDMIRKMCYKLERLGVRKSTLDDIVAPTKGTWKPVSELPTVNGLYLVEFYNSRWNWWERTKTVYRKFLNGVWTRPYFDHAGDGVQMTRWYDEPGPYKKYESSY